MNKRMEKQYRLPMPKFLRDYCHIKDEDLICKLGKLSHRQLKEVCKNAYQIRLSTLPFEAVNEIDLCCGNIILVTDAYKHVAPYKNPEIINVDEIISQNPNPSFEIQEMEYDDIIDLIEDNLTVEDVKIKSIGSFKIK